MLSSMAPTILARVSQSTRPHAYWERRWFRKIWCERLLSEFTDMSRKTERISLSPVS